MRKYYNYSICMYVFYIRIYSCGFFKVEHYSKINNIVDDNLGLLKYKVSKEERGEVEKLISIGNYLNFKRIEKNKIQPSF
ncbi:hypothetical protein Q5M85_19500 [Paraclostridium bifermentans]|nr:hypothetical protein [Paraclostridium bifermentans]